VLADGVVHFYQLTSREFSQRSNEKNFAKKRDFEILCKKYEFFALKFLHNSRVFVQKVAFFWIFCV